MVGRLLLAAIFATALASAQDEGIGGGGGEEAAAAVAVMGGDMGGGGMPAHAAAVQARNLRG